jgi:hypothetical protein
VFDKLLVSDELGLAEVVSKAEVDDAGDRIGSREVEGWMEDVSTDSFAFTFSFVDPIARFCAGDMGKWQI